jgi:hypothetical protein
MSIINTLIEKYNGKIFEFKDLSIPSQKSIIHYLAWDSDGEYWNIIGDPFEDSDKDINDNFSKYIAEHRKEKFGYVEIPLSIVDENLFTGIEDKKFLLASEDKEYLNQTYKEHGCFTSNEIWPCFLSSVGPDDMGLIEDGWNRIAYYIKNKVDPIPFIYFI